MPPQNDPLLNQALDNPQNADLGTVKQSQQRQTSSFSTTDILDIDELMSFSTEQNEDYQQVVSSCLSKHMDSKQRLVMFNILAKNINLGNKKSENCEPTMPSNDGDFQMLLTPYDSDQSEASAASQLVESSSSSSNNSLESSNHTKKKERQKRRPRRYKYNPKPLIEKTGRNTVPGDKKDDEYWEKRHLNNMAARKTREERRSKELEVLNTIDRLQKDNVTLKDYLAQLENKNQFLIAEFTKRQTAV